MSTLNVGHRGASRLAPENTLAGARKALQVGADMWELDVAVTADGVLVLAHDDSLLRTSNARAVFPEREPWLLKDFTLAELRQLDFGSWFNATAPPSTDPHGPAAVAEYAAEPIPTLREALLFTREHSWRVDVELKDLKGAPGERHVVEDSIDLIQELGMLGDVLVTSFQARFLQRARQLAPDLSLGVLVFTPDPDPAGLVQRLSVQAYLPPAHATPPLQVEQLRAAGLEVYPWTVNDEAAMREYILAGASGILTDVPHRLRSILDESRRA
ncbi:MAG TPA: glycerophosphodiester phosphodiesterase family protein [Anaerolineales bacterium]|nr:glycerophosphodiester phosphodiesterase family protein [Anaerolineales bacterium]